MVNKNIYIKKILTSLRLFSLIVLAFELAYLLIFILFGAIFSALLIFTALINLIILFDITSISNIFGFTSLIYCLVSVIKSLIPVIRRNIQNGEDTPIIWLIGIGQGVGLTLLATILKFTDIGEENEVIMFYSVGLMFLPTLIHGLVEYFYQQRAWNDN